MFRYKWLIVNLKLIKNVEISLIIFKHIPIIYSILLDGFSSALEIIFDWILLLLVNKTIRWVSKEKIRENYSRRLYSFFIAVGGEILTIFSDSNDEIVYEND